MYNVAFRAAVKRLRKHYRMGAIGRMSMRQAIVDAFVTTFNRYPRRFLK